MEWTKESFRVTDDRAELDLGSVVAFLQEAWRKGQSQETIAQAFAKSLCFGLFEGNRQIGFARAVTDATFVSWICDVYVDPRFRGKGLGRWLMECIASHPDLVRTRLVLSSVPEACGFYEAMGFQPMARGYALPPRP